MRYLVAWVLGVPGVVIVIWFLMSGSSALKPRAKYFQIRYMVIVE